MLVANVLQNEIDCLPKAVTHSELARVTNKSTSAINRFFSGTNKLDFDSIVKMVRRINPAKETDIMKNICANITKPSRQILAMEYCSTARDFENLSSLINELKNGSPRDKDWATVYEISYDYQSERIPDEDIMNKINSYLPKTLHMNIFIKLIKANLLYELKEYKSMWRLTKSIKELIKDIPEGYIQNSYEVRLNELIARVYLYVLNDTSKAREFSNKVIVSNINENFKAASHSYIGISYFFEDYDASLINLEIHRDLLKTQGRHDDANSVEKRQIAFLKILWGRDLNGVNLGDLSETAHYEAKWGDADKAKELIAKAVETDGQSPFKLYYEAVATGSTELLFESMTRFINDGNKFFAQLPKQLLDNDEVYGSMANIVYENFKIA